LEENADNGASAAAAGAGPIAGLTRSVATLLATLTAIAQTRLELLSAELQQEVHRVAEITVWTLIALLSAWMGLFLAALAIIFFFWDTHRLLATAIVTAFFIILAFAAMLVVRGKVRGRPRLLEATLTELAKDRERLAGRQR
jgi:uncharacterized membrane protein YqjE